MSIAIKQNISIMSIFHIEKISENSIACQTFSKIFLSEIDFFSKIWIEKSRKCPFFFWKLSFDIIYATCIIDVFQEARCRASYYYFIRPKENIQVFDFIENLFKPFHQLNCKNFLPKIVICFWHYTSQTPGLILTGIVWTSSIIFDNTLEFITKRITHSW